MGGRAARRARDGVPASGARAVVVTGASSGIGRETALRLDRRGLRVFATVRRPEDAAEVEGEASDRLSCVYLDVRDEKSIAEAAARVRTALGRSGLNGLVNNAGVGIPGPLEFLPLDGLREQLEVNLVGPLAVIQALLPLLRAARGRIVNVGSMAGLVATPFAGPYSASKFALEALTDTLRLELRAAGVEVAIVEPGATITRIYAKVIERGDAGMARLPVQARRLYGEAFRRVRRGTEIQARKGMSPERVAAAIEHALLARRPRTRYLVGRDAVRLVRLIRPLPDRLRDRALLRLMRLSDV